ncbi:MAG TPA: choice-of-anchor Q domain-containing protein [Solirubrobacteraceae bacterium]|nr:choice-of-anchor Q domain-containing protein [Solirubrobacteraceae bacterium]
MSHKWLARWRMYVVALTLAATASLMLAAGAGAATFVVHNTAELETAVTSANGNGVANTIELMAGTYLPGKTLIFTNTGGTQTLAGPAGKIGEATPGVQINGGAVTEVAGVSEKELVIVKTGVTVTLKHVVVTSGGGGGNPGIDDAGALDVENATISGNLGSQISVESGASANLTNSTLSDGHEFGLVDEGTASLLNVTVVHNASSGIGSGAGTLSLTNTIVALNGGSAQCGSIAITNDHSLASDASCGGEAALQSKTPLLQTSLSNDGGSTTLYSEKAGSPTIDAGDPAKCPATDQRGYPRPDVGGTACDIGADEYSPTPPTITVPAEIVTPATSSSGAVVTYSVEATDPDALVKSLSCLPASGATFKVGTTKVECTAVDGHENTAKASFNVKVTTPKHTLTVTATGEGTVTSTPAGIECGQGHTACSAEFEEIAVTLTSAPATGYSVSWGGACSGTGSCSFNPMSANESVTATFSSGPVNTVLPVISGTPYNGQTLKTTNGTWTGSPTSYTYQWEDCNSSGASCVNIAGATAGEYTLTSADIEHTIRVVVVASNSSGASLPAESAATAVVTASVGIVVEGKVPFTQTLATTCSPVVLGSFLPGKTQEYHNTCGLKATSTAAESKLVAEDASATDTGHLVQVYTHGAFKETYELPEPLESKATSTQGGIGGVLTSLVAPTTLLTYAKPFSEDETTVTFNQKIGLHDHLHTGTYAKTVTLTLSTTTP